MFPFYHNTFTFALNFIFIVLSTEVNNNKNNKDRKEYEKTQPNYNNFLWPNKTCN